MSAHPAADYLDVWRPWLCEIAREGPVGAIPFRASHECRACVIAVGALVANGHDELTDTRAEDGRAAIQRSSDWYEHERAAHGLPPLPVRTP